MRQELELSAQRRGAVIAVDGLRVMARATLDETAGDEAVVARPRRGAQRAERVIRVAAVDRDVVEQVAVARIRADEQRQRRRLVGGLAAVEEEFAAELDVVAERLLDIREGRITLDRYVRVSAIPSYAATRLTTSSFFIRSIDA